MCIKISISFSVFLVFSSKEIPIVGLKSNQSKNVFFFATPAILEVVNFSNFLIVPETLQGTLPHNATGNAPS